MEQAPPIQCRWVGRDAAGQVRAADGGDDLLGQRGGFDAGVSPRVTIYYDGAFVSQQRGLFSAIYDLERFEILRGPQGTLYGKNTTGGSINMISRKPGDEFAANIDRESRSVVGKRGAFDPRQIARDVRLNQDIRSPNRMSSLAGEL